MNVEQIHLLMKTVIIRVVLVFFINYFCPRLLEFRLVQLEERLSDGQTGFDARVQISEPVFYLAIVMRTTPSTMSTQNIPAGRLYMHILHPHPPYSSKLCTSDTR